MKFSLRCIDRKTVGRNKWNSFTDQSSEAWLWHRYETLDALEHWPGRKDASFSIADSMDNIVCIVPTQIVREKKFLLSMRSIDSFGGPAFRDGVSGRDRRLAIEYFVKRHLALTREYECSATTYSVAAMTPFIRGAQCPRVNPLLVLGCENTLGQTWVLDLSKGKSALWDQFQGRARTAIRKAEKHGVTVRLADRYDDLEIYFNLHCETYSRTGLTPHPKAYFQAIWRDFFMQGFSKIWFAELNGKVVAAENFGIFKGAAIYWTGAATTLGLEVEANSLLQWTAMQWMVDAKLSWYETGEAFPNLSVGKARGLSNFKKSFGGELYLYFKSRVRTESKMFKLMRLAKEVIK